MTKLSAESIAMALGGKKQGDGFMARCPSHDDHNPSLRITDGSDGKLLLYCHAGCKFEDILSSLGSKGIYKYETTAKESDSNSNKVNIIRSENSVLTDEPVNPLIKDT